MNLDDLDVIAQQDSADMLARIGELPEQCAAAWEQAQQLDLALGDRPIQQIVIAGMGGSAIGGALLQDLVDDQCDVPITLVRGYTLPAFAAGPDTLVIACSYSGNTAETLSCFNQATERDARRLVITTGGKLAARARGADASLIQFDYQSQPRAALGYSFVLLMGAFHHLELIRDYTADVEEAVEVMRAWQSEIGPEASVSSNPAKQMALRIHGQLPVIYGGGFLSATANRWKTQLNENAKSWAFFELLPELDHNAVVGLGLPETIREQTLVLLLRSPLSERRMAERYAVTQELLQREGVTTAEVSGRGQRKLAQILSLIHFGDYVSFYTAMLNGVDPTPVETIAFLKQRLAQVSGASE